jgi:hypothetical protein
MESVKKKSTVKIGETHVDSGGLIYGLVSLRLAELKDRHLGNPKDNGLCIYVEIELISEGLPDNVVGRKYSHRVFEQIEEILKKFSSPRPALDIYVNFKSGGTVQWEDLPGFVQSLQGRFGSNFVRTE